MKIENDYTNGIEVAQEIANVLAKTKKTLFEYVEEFSEDVITNGIYNINGIQDIFPGDFGECYVYDMLETFPRLVDENIAKKTTLRAKLYLIARSLLEEIRDAGNYIHDYGEDILYDVDYRVEQIYGKLAEIEERNEIVKEITKLLVDKTLDNSKTETITFSRFQIEDNKANGYANIHLLSHEHSNSYFIWPSDLINSDNNGKQISDDDECWIKVPENLIIIVYSSNKSPISMTPTEIKEYIK